jgi:hypothetical protein
MKILTTDFTDLHGFFFSLRSLRLCGSLFLQEFPMSLRHTKSALSLPKGWMKIRGTRGNSELET